MISLTASWGALALGIGALGSHDEIVIGLILLGMALVMWFVNAIYTAWVTNANASANFAAAETRRRSGGAV